MEGLVPPIPATSEDIITLTTDFGLDDGYVAAMKGVILEINPEATIVDICHSIEPQNILQGAFVLSTAFCYFPQDTVHLVVVDPGIGGHAVTDDQIVALYCWTHGRTQGQARNFKIGYPYVTP